jgi:RNA polymerase sigma-70 factor (ECF subfamily)
MTTRTAAHRVFSGMTTFELAGSPPEQLPDEEEARLRTSAEEEFREFVAGRSPALLRTAYLLVGGDWASAEDLLQVALTKTYLAWGRIRDLGAVEAYARKTLATTVISWRRRRWHGERATDELPETVRPDHSGTVVERDALWELVRRLPTKQRAVLVLRFYEDLSEADTAATLGVTTGTVKSHTSRALKALRHEVATTGGEAWTR